MANLQYSILSGTELSGAHLESTNFQGANLKDAHYLTIKQLSRVKALYDAKLNGEHLTLLKK